MIVYILTGVNDLGEIESQSLYLSHDDAEKWMYEEWTRMNKSIGEEQLIDRSFSNGSAFIAYKRYGEAHFISWVIKAETLGGVATTNK